MSDEPLRLGERVQVLTWWAYNSDPAWFGGYVFVCRSTLGVIVRRVGASSEFDGLEHLERADRVRREEGAA